MIDSALFYAFAVPAVLVMGISKGGLGSGLGIIATPLVALAVPAPQAAAILLPILLVMDAVGLFAYRGVSTGAISGFSSRAASGAPCWARSPSATSAMP